MGQDNRLFVSFSGGETSALMTNFILNSERYRDHYDEIIVLFANTGQEHEETLEFVKKCDEQLGFGTVWVEAIIHHNTKKGPTARVVDFCNASRKGEPFEEMIKKYGIPNSSFPSCTRDLKLNPMKDYLRSKMGWEPGTYDTAIGIRVDEIDRKSVKAEENRVVYPLISDIPTTKKQVNNFWASQTFRLNLKGYQGNCKWCWKKSMRKHLTIMDENPEWFDFPDRMEKEYSHVGPEFQKEDLREGYHRTFFRGRLSVQDLRNKYEEEKYTFTKADDDHIEEEPFDPDLDTGSGCEESCEVFSDENLGNLNDAD